MTLMSMTVPFREGGGLVFPIGFPGAGYRLDEWQFERYRALLDQRLMNHPLKRDSRVLRLSLYVLLALVLGVSAAVNTTFADSSLAQVLRPWLQVLWLAPAAPLCAYILVFNCRSIQDFKRRCAAAPRAPRTAHLSRRILGYVAARSLRPVRELLLTVVLGELSVLLFFVGLGASVIVLHVIAGLLLLAALFKAWQLLIYWRFRHRHGRAPVPADLAPVESPPFSSGA